MIGALLPAANLLIARGLLGFAIGVLLASMAAWVTLRRYLKRQLAAERRARAAERMAEIGSMTGGLAHEIKNPLSTIGLNAQLLAESIEDLEIPDDERSRLLGRARTLRREIDRLGGILTDFLEFAGQIHIDPAPADLNGIADELVDFYLPESERQGIKLRADPAGEPVRTVVDVKLVKQALLNLMLNATQAMTGAAGERQPGAVIGELILRVRTGRDPDGGRTGQIHVIDTGPGMPPERLSQIFTPYFTTRSGGSGLGLPTARRIVLEHGGRIEVHSDVGRGTDFVVVLPLDGAVEGAGV